MNDRFLWKDGDLIFSRTDKKPTKEQLARANRALLETILQLRRRT